MSRFKTSSPKPTVPPPKRRRPRADQLIVRWVLVLLVLATFTLVAFRLLRSGALPNVELAGHEVGTLDEAALQERVAEIAAERESEPVEVRREGTAGTPAASRSYERRELGYRVDVAATTEQILERGRQGNPLAALRDQMLASFRTIEVDPVVTFDETRLDRWVARVRDQLATDSSEGGIEFKGARVKATLPKPGVTIDHDALREQAEEAILDDGEISLAAPVEPVEPDMTAREVRRAKRRAKEVLSAPITLKRGGIEAKISPQQIAAALSAGNVEEDGKARILIEVDLGLFERAAAGSLDALAQDATDATFQLSSGRVRIVPGRPGIAVDVPKVADSLVRIATSKDRIAPAPVRKVRPDFSTKDARKLNIDEKVSSFTTYHSCCEPRVENIHRIADILDGTVVEPGESFSINDTVGERTTAKGFVPAPAISDGEYVDEVGGGISQFATTMFNAIFFGGYQFDEYKAHSYYISRYPMGREATVSYPSPDLAFTNDSSSGIYIDTSYTDTSITVTFYGTKERSVRSVSGEPHSYTSPKTQCKVNKSLRRGESRVIQSGTRGFDITVTRVFGNGTEEDFDTTYLPVPEIVEKRKC